MDADEARTVLAAELAKLRPLSHAALVERLLGNEETSEVRGPSGASYQVELQAFWDDRPGGTLRVVGAVDDGGVRAFAPLTDDFLVPPGE
ncbi:MAG TPA: hypothetical protein VD704_11800 [Gaiellaceae bacterium]|nr:hypothetical protein [Gaiellaceae bacterium]